MTKLLLEEPVVQSLKCREGVAHWEAVDTLMPGLFVDVQASGRLTYRLRYVEGGRRKIVTIGSVRVIKLEEARAEARRILRGIRTAQNASPLALQVHQMTVANFFVSQYLPYVKSYKRSWKTDESMIRNHVTPLMGARLMIELTPGEIAAAINQMLGSGYSPGTCNRFLILLRYGFKLAKRWFGDVVQHNPASDLTNLRYDNRVERYLTQEQTALLFDALMLSPNKALIFIVQFFIYTGARKREALDAQWADVDFGRRLWRIPKTKSGKVRHVPLSSEAMNLLTAWRAALPPETRYVFPNPDTGLPFVSIFYSWDAARRRAGLPELR